MSTLSGSVLRVSIGLSVFDQHDDGSPQYDHEKNPVCCPTQFSALAASDGNIRVEHWLKGNKRKHL
jgi:hypothetical protein